MSKYDSLPAGVDPLEHFHPGVAPSPVDPRDWPLSAVQSVPAALPAQAECAALPVANQGSWGACAVFAALRLYAGDVARQGGTPDDYSEQFLYALARQSEGGICNNVGTVPRDLMSILVGSGTLLETEEPYQGKDLCWTPSAAEIATAGTRKAVSYANAATLDGVRAAVASGRRVMICMTLMRNFQPDGAGVIPMPAGGVWGGHAMTICGYDDSRRLLTVENQWSAGWGVGGRCYISYDLFNLNENAGGAWKGDLWTLQVPAPAPPPDPTPATTQSLRIFAAPAGAGGYEWQATMPLPAGVTTASVAAAIANDADETLAGPWVFMNAKETNG